MTFHMLNYNLKFYLNLVYIHIQFLLNLKSINIIVPEGVFLHGVDEAFRYGV